MWRFEIYLWDIMNEEEVREVVDINQISTGLSDKEVWIEAAIKAYDFQTDSIALISINLLSC